MPELPEVQTIARELLNELREQRILSFDLLSKGAVNKEYGAMSPSQIARHLPGSMIRRVWRRGKLLLIDIVTLKKKELTICFHLKMTGRLLVTDTIAAPDKHCRLRFRLPDGRALFFADSRKFGFCRVMTQQALSTWPFYKSLGPEPLEVSVDDFVELFKGRRGQVKPLLLDQNFIAGVGNIYADESLFRAGILPHALASSVERERLEALHASLQDVLKEAIAANGSSINDYRDAHGDAGAFQNEFRVYGRAGEACVNCGSELQRRTVAGRATVFCPKCQH
ncbi:bifunctional DNA-formamidopyrimidine glycosylase/DNA-(apurinic or apyrimidinic site) lyase [Desulfobaculum bizertense]|uniref:Formamidopyrimidine-DNA glycosylase n=1 Tax=Desulfobaculum bizertense DSM 18034 TaxID=1121442 RepID=A0A1T4VIG6_9BACT|nr:bifunctional DNA-formamidopyrimidine glycosylase/DNA-(apurinic or apyrimidinic site) lyase [Desulfobaculum bizertense]UIJ37908.1 bifunctional DNA-formamidopyrimidine glycosylase/DNA-(apurinic or apyrimidinic site) lyase [Desulfobaculum bizertense]SKA64703.1 DNA-(apurinic or apyrimidinic site) lyase [Desulfobaculum bizertense DSM 18034]